MKPYRHFCLALSCTCAVFLSATAAAQTSDEEFVGPFASWLDVKRDFGAVGDGRADDTVTLQRALDAVREHQRSSVVYLPAGT